MPLTTISPMPKTLITGSTGFIGSHLARVLARRGDELRLLIRRESGAELLEGIEYERVNGDITDRRAVRRALEGASRVFHVAGMTSMRAADAQRVFDVNAGGTRIVAEEALAAGVERLVHTSSVAAIGPAPRGGRADETQPFTAGGLGVAYVNSKHEAETEILRAAAKGLDAVIVNPTFVLGPGGRGSGSMGLIRRFLERRIPVYVDGGLNVVDARDVADGHLLAEAKGETGERYILGARNFTLQRLFADLARISGVPAPTVRLGPELATAGSEIAERLGLPLSLAADEARSASQWWTYSSAKAKRELGFTTRPHEETLEDAVANVTAALGGRVDREPSRAEAAMEAAGRLANLAGRLSPF